MGVEHDDDVTVMEIAPCGRYVRYTDLLGRGACKKVFRAFDKEEGREVAWNQVDMAGAELGPGAKAQLFEEIHVLQALHHKNIMAFYHWWYDEENRTLNFITELFPSGTLRQFRRKARHLNEHVIKRWAFQILTALTYMHGHEPPIIHRDLKCDNVFYNGCTGIIKIGDLGLATAHRSLAVVGTPEFMAPEIYDEEYNEKVDVYAFGMLLLEVVTLEYPYCECRNVAQIFRKATLGIPPQALERVQSDELRDFIRLCISHDPGRRPEARQLLKHAIFDSLRVDCGGGLSRNNSLSSVLSPFGTSPTGRRPGTMPRMQADRDRATTVSVAAVMHRHAANSAVEVGSHTSRLGACAYASASGSRQADDDDERSTPLRSSCDGGAGRAGELVDRASQQHCMMMPCPARCSAAGGDSSDDDDEEIIVPLEVLAQAACEMSRSSSAGSGRSSGGGEESDQEMCARMSMPGNGNDVDGGHSTQPVQTAAANRRWGGASITAIAAEVVAAADREVAPPAGTAPASLAAAAGEESSRHGRLGSSSSGQPNTLGDSGHGQEEEEPAMLCRALAHMPSLLRQSLMRNRSSALGPIATAASATLLGPSLALVGEDAAAGADSLLGDSVPGGENGDSGVAVSTNEEGEERQSYTRPVQGVIIRVRQARQWGLTARMLKRCSTL